jgi:hypothetical protein
VADCICIIKSKPQLEKLLHLVYSFNFHSNFEPLFSFSENKDLQLNPNVPLPKIVHMRLAIPGCDDILAIVLIICSNSRLLAVKRLQTNCQVIDDNSVETNSFTKDCSLWIYCEPCSSQ